MSKKCNTITGVLQRKGTDQLLRNALELDPASVDLMDFDLEDWMKFAYNFAKHVNYFGEEDSKIPDGNWQSFFKDNTELKTLLEEVDQSNSLTPHLTLFICFLRLLDFSKERFNKITKRHLDFFYSEVLKIDKIPAESDSAYVVFELAKSFDQEKLAKGLELDGGKDASGNQLIYELTEELAANKAKVAQLKNVYYHKSGSLNDGPDADHYMRVSSVANSLDGKGEPFSGEDTSWLPFGSYQDEVTAPTGPWKNTALEKAKIGFSIGADILKLSEGERHIQFSVNFRDTFETDEAPTFDELKESIEVFYTIKNKWEGPISLIQKDTEGTTESNSVYDYDTIVESKTASLYVKLDYKDEPTSAYNQEIHLGNLTSESPVFRFIIDVNTESGAKVFKAFSTVITDVNIQVGVNGMHQLILDSDTGKLNPDKPMYPFTTNPMKGANLVIDHAEIFEKNWNSVDVEIKWQNTPDSFVEWYEAYQDELLGSLSTNAYAQSQKTNFSSTNLTNTTQNWSAVPVNLGVPNVSALPDKLRLSNTAGTNPIVKRTNHFQAIKYVKFNNQWTKVSSDEGPKVALFSERGSEDTEAEEGIQYECVFSIENPSVQNESAGPIKLSLNTSFLHDMYPQLYAIALSSNDESQLIPNKPYTPLCEEIVLSYTAEDTISFSSSSEEEFENRNITLFHEHPFGHTIEHDYLREKHNALVKTCSLTPKVEKGGELYIGLENAVNLQTISLFVQLLEGSENPLVESFNALEGVEWEVLCSDFWQPLDTLAIKMNQIDNFLKSGLVRLEIPKDATDDNMQLEKDLIWVKAVMPKSYDAVCRVLDISTQGAKAVFVNNDNNLTHLEKGLPADSISKLKDRVAFVKSVAQPFNSFDGKPEENDASYYKRVSERLRHKNRAIMLWDYENIILEEFQDIYRVKCLNHTNTKSFLAAGCVTVVVVPDTVNKNMFNILQPRVSTAMLNKIKSYVSQLTSLHVNLHVINPDYEEVEIKISVKFHTEFDRVLYAIELNEDLKKFLSPWAFDEAKNVEFGVTLHRSVLINFVERLPYVDYILSIDMKVGEIGVLGVSVKNATPSNPKSILVSAEQHEITAITDSAQTVSTIEAEC